MKVFLPAAFLFLFFNCALFAGVDKSKVYVVANKNNSDSLKLAEYYCGARGIDRKNIIFVSVKNASGISRHEYERDIAEPVIKELIGRKAVSAFAAGEDRLNSRKIYVFNSHNVDFIVLCKLPYKVMPKNSAGMHFDGASVDSELAATFLPMKSLAGPCANPLYGNYSSVDGHKTFGVLRVARLDGDTFETAKRSIDSALAAEKKGLRGRAYIDKSKKFKLGDKWLDVAASILRGLHYDISVDERPALFDYTQRMDAPAFYFGWYWPVPKFYFAENSLKMADGAIALHLFSFSAQQLWSKGWTLRLLQCGAAQAFGNVYEPYLSGTHNIGAIMAGYARGLCAGEVAYASISVLSWQSVVVGDPLYEPFKVDLKSQLEAIEKGEVDEFSQYVVLREMNRMLAEGLKVPDTVGFAEKYVGSMPDEAILLRLILDCRQDPGKAEKYSGLLLSRDIYSSAGLCGIAFELARFLESESKFEEALGVYSKLADSKALSEPGKRAAVAKASALAAKHKISMPENLAIMRRNFAEKDAALAAKKKK